MFFPSNTQKCLRGRPKNEKNHSIDKNINHTNEIVKLTKNFDLFKEEKKILIRKVKKKINS